MNTLKNPQDKSLNPNIGEIIMYQPDDSVRLEVRVEDDTVWLTQAQMVELFQRDVSVISRHIANIFKEGELEKERNLHFLQIPFSDKPVVTYSLDVIISVGYRVKSKRGTQFRIWANRVLKEYLLRGIAVNQRIDRLERKLAEHDQKFDLLLKTSQQQNDGLLQNEISQLKHYFEAVLADYNDINEDTRMQLELINKALAELQSKNKWIDRPRNPIGFKK
ncbi:MAG: virulence RhuM family protein [Bacteroidales bacterium]|jgi:hypothetical protein|nr:virulence RhuM family protein [Bacteroidales bacterium]